MGAHIEKYGEILYCESRAVNVCRTIEPVFISGRVFAASLRNDSESVVVRACASQINGNPASRLLSLRLRDRNGMMLRNLSAVVVVATLLKRATVFFDPQLHAALRLKAASTNRTLSDLVIDAVRQALAEDREDLDAFDERATEPTMSYEALLSDLKSHGKI